MEFEFLERLWAVCSDENHHLPEGDNLNELFRYIREVQTANRCMEDQLKKLELGTDKEETLYNCVSVVSWAYEKQGFINGMRLGMMLARELGQM